MYSDVWVIIGGFLDARSLISTMTVSSVVKEGLYGVDLSPYCPIMHKLTRPHISSSYTICTNNDLRNKKYNKIISYTSVVNVNCDILHLEGNRANVRNSVVDLLIVSHRDYLYQPTIPLWTVKYKKLQLDCSCELEIAPSMEFKFTKGDISSLRNVLMRFGYKSIILL